MDRPVFHIEGLRFAFGHRAAILDLNLRIERGHFYGIVGPNGCGKTTLLMLMMGYYRAHQGRLLFEDRDVSRHVRRLLATKMALVPQDFTINFDFSVRDVVMMGRYPYIPRFTSPPPAEKEKVTNVMEEMGVAELADRSVMALSGGEKQRVVFARALAQDTPVLLLDEATSNMDIHHTLHALNRVAWRVRKEDKTVIGIFHDLNLAAMYCDRLIFMLRGSVLAEGETRTILNEEIIEKVFGVKCKIEDHTLTSGKQVLFQKDSRV